MGRCAEKQQQLVQTLEVIRRADDSPASECRGVRPRTVGARLGGQGGLRHAATRVRWTDWDVVLPDLGWERRSEVPSESVFSRAFAEFSDTQLPQRVHEARSGTPTAGWWAWPLPRLGPSRARELWPRRLRHLRAQAQTGRLKLRNEAKEQPAKVDRSGVDLSRRQRRLGGMAWPKPAARQRRPRVTRTFRTARDTQERPGSGAGFCLCCPVFYASRLGPSLRPAAVFPAAVAATLSMSSERGIAVADGRACGRSWSRT